MVTTIFYNFKLTESESRFLFVPPEMTSEMKYLNIVVSSHHRFSRYKT